MVVVCVCVVGGGTHHHQQSPGVEILVSCMYRFSISVTDWNKTLRPSDNSNGNPMLHHTWYQQRQPCVAGMTQACQADARHIPQ